MRRTFVGGRRVVVVAGERRIGGTGGPAADMPTRNTGVSHKITFGEEEIGGKCLTSAWRRSMSSTRKTPEHPGPAYNLPAEAGLQRLRGLWRLWRLWRLRGRGLVG
jgi:hypothetical protein